MDFTTGLVIAIGIFAIVVGVILFFNRGKTKVKMSNKLGNFEATNEVTSKEYGIVLEDAKSNEGGLSVEDTTGQGAQLKKIAVQKDINISVSDHSKKKA